MAVNKKINYGKKLGKFTMERVKRKKQVICKKYPFKQITYFLRIVKSQKKMRDKYVLSTLHIEPISSSRQPLPPLLVYHQTFQNSKNHT